MTLIDFLPSIAHNPKLYLKIIESDNTPLIYFDAAGYQSINTELGAREIDKITIAEEENVLKILLKMVPEPEPEPTPDPEPDDNPQDPEEPTDPVNP